MTESIIRFSELALAAPILQAVAEVGYETPSPIQAASIPPLLAGRDLLGMAQTGTGKTAAFALPLLSRLDLRQQHPQLLVLTPTRELAIQVAEAMQTYARHLDGFHILPVYGGQGMGTQLRQLKRGVHVVVGTPGRIQDHLRRGTLQLERLASVVLDEADEMLRMGFIDDVEEILRHVPETRQIALFSATMPEAIKRVAKTYLREPVEVKIKTKTTTVATITQRYWQVSGVHKLDALTRILEVENFDGVIMFVRTKNATVELAEKLEARGYSAAPLNGDMNQALREKTVERFKRGALDILIATDVAARGLDVERISHVINYDIPHDTESYVHRIGRTGRAGRKGDAILFVAPRERRMLRMIEKATGQPITEMHLPSHEALADKRVMQFKQLISETLAAQDLTYFAELLDSYAAEHNVGPGEVAAALAYLVQRERPLAPARSNKTEYARAPAAETVETVKSHKPARQADAKATGRVRQARQDRTGQADIEMVRYRLEVGRNHGVQPRHIVGAIANEADIDSAYIGHINIQDDYSTVDLPAGMPKELLQHLRNVWILNRKLNLSVLSDKSPHDKPSRDKASRDKPSRHQAMREKPARSKPRQTKAASKSTAKSASKAGSRTGHSKRISKSGVR